MSGEKQKGRRERGGGASFVFTSARNTRARIKSDSLNIKHILSKLLVYLSIDLVSWLVGYLCPRLFSLSLSLFFFFSLLLLPEPHSIIQSSNPKSVIKSHLSFLFFSLFFSFFFLFPHFPYSHYFIFLVSLSYVHILFLPSFLLPPFPPPSFPSSFFLSFKSE